MPEIRLLGILPVMTAEREDPTLSVGGPDDELSARLTKELTAFNAAVTGADDEADLSVQVTDGDGELVGGLTGWTRGGGAASRCCGSVPTAAMKGGAAGCFAPRRMRPGSVRPYGGRAARCRTERRTWVS